MTPVTLPEAKYCCNCGYPLTGLEQCRCPECSEPFNLQDPRTFCREARRIARLYVGLAASGLALLGLAVLMLWIMTHVGSPRHFAILAAYLVAVVVAYCLELCVLAAAIAAVWRRRVIRRDRSMIVTAIVLSAMIVFGLPGIPMCATLVGRPFVRP
jgi:hypothetical protein